VDVEKIKSLYEYNVWANTRIVRAASRLTQEQFTKNLGGSFQSVRNTLVHIMSAEWVWLMRCEGVSPKEMLAASEFPTLDSLKQRWGEIAREQSVFFGTVTEESLNSFVTYTNFQGETFSYTLWQILQHNVNHSTYHRGQLTTMLRLLGAEPVATDFLLFYDS